MKRNKQADHRDQALLAQVIPGRASTSPKSPARSQMPMASLCSGKAVVALEIARAASGNKQFLLRAESRNALLHLASQIQSSAPQAEIRRRDKRGDPLRITDGEEVSVIELLPGSVPYHSLRLWRVEERGREVQSADPLLGILSTLDQLPEGMRSVAQLSLSPLPPTWGRKWERLGVEHPLQQERDRRMQERQYRGRPSSLSWGTILAMGLFAAFLVSWSALGLSRFLPTFVAGAIEEALQGRMPTFTTEQSLWLLGAGLGTAIVLALLSSLIRLLIERIGQRPLYDPRRVAEKINKSAYRARVRLYVISACQETRTRVKINWRRPFLKHASLLGQMMGDWWRGLAQARVRRALRMRALEQLLSAYRAFHADAYFVPRRLSPHHAQVLLRGETHRQGFSALAVWAASWSAGVSRSRLILSYDEVSSLWHLPGDEAAEMPWLERQQERSLLVPHALTENAAAGWPLGVSEQAGQEAEVLLPSGALSRHTLCLGRTGKGKSTLFQHFAMAQLSLGTGGLCVVEPHGDLIARVLELIPSERAEEVTLINLADRMYPPGVNPLDMTQQQDVDRATSTLLGTLKTIWSQSGAWGARQENALRMGIRSLLEANQDMVAELGEQGHNQQYTVLDLVPLFEYSGFRRRVLARVGDIYLRNWWFSFFERLEPSNQDDITTPIITKISAYSSSESSRRILGQPVSTIHFPDLVARGGIVLINTSSGQVGRDVSSLLGATLLSFFSEALSHQLTQAREERRNWLMLIDEFSNYPVNYEYLLSEMRKAGLSLTLAAQSLSQLDKQDETLRPTVFANAEHLFVFALSGEDAYLSLRELGSTLTTEDIVKQADLSCYVRLSQSGKPLPLFSMHLSQPPTGDPTIASSILARCRKQGRGAKEVDTLLWTLAARHTPFGKGDKGASSTGEGEDEQDGERKAPPPPSSPLPGGKGGGRQTGNRERKQSGKS